MINDNDDAIAKLMADMRMAAHEDRELNQKVSFTIYTPGFFIWISRLFH